MKRDRLDEAIDLVAARLTRVAEAPDFTQRVVASLPERVTWVGWLTQSWAPRVALAIVLTYVLTDVHRPLQTDVPTTVPANPSTNVATNLVTNVATNVRPNASSNARPNPPSIVRPSALSNAGPSDRLNVPDFERSLAALEDFETLAPVELPERSAIGLAPLVVVDLPLTGETSPDVDER